MLTPRQQAAAPSPAEAVGGHAHYAAQARVALALPSDLRHVAHAPAPLFHSVVAVAVCAVAVLARPQQLGLAWGVGLDAALLTVTVLALAHYDRLVCPAGSRPGWEAGVLPLAALVALATVLGGTSSIRTGTAAVLGAAAVVAVVPHLSALRAVGRETVRLRVLREAVGVAVLAPVLLVAVITGPDRVVRGLVVLLTAALAGFDAVRSERTTVLRALLAAVSAAVAVALVVAVGTWSSGEATAAAAALLVLWYGLRGIAGAAAAVTLTRRLVGEYGVFVVAGAVLLAFAGAGG